MKMATARMMARMPRKSNPAPMPPSPAAPSPDSGPVESIEMGRDIGPGIRLSFTLDQRTELGRAALGIANQVNDAVNVFKRIAAKYGGNGEHIQSR